MFNRMQNIWKAVWLFLAGEFLQAWIWPLAVTTGGVVIGWLQEFPLFYLYLAAVLLFAASSTALLRFSEWRYRNRVADKLGFHRLRIDKVLDENGVVKAPRIGALLSSKALFPITLKTVDVKTKFDNLYPPKKPFQQTKFTVPVEGGGWFDDHYIVIPEKRSGVI